MIISVEHPGRRLPIGIDVVSRQREMVGEERPEILALVGERRDLVARAIEGRSLNSQRPMKETQ